MLGCLLEAVSVGRGFLGGVLRGSRRHRGIRVFRYHGVIEKKSDPVLERNHHLLKVFRAQMAYLRRFRVLSLDELLDAVERPDRSSISASVVTFDDGFANNMTVAEVMQGCRLPWCLFVPVGEVGEDRAMWLDELSLLLLAGNTPRVEILGSAWPLTCREEREQVLPGAASPIQAAVRSRDAAGDGRASVPVSRRRVASAHRSVSGPPHIELARAR